MPRAVPLGRWDADAPQHAKHGARFSGFLQGAKLYKRLATVDLYASGHECMLHTWRADRGRASGHCMCALDPLTIDADPHVQLHTHASTPACYRLDIAGHQSLRAGKAALISTAAAELPALPAVCHRQTNHVYATTAADVDAFDAGLFGMSVAEALSLDPQQRLLLEAAHVVLSSSGLRRQAGFSGAGADISAAGPTAPAARRDSCPWHFDMSNHK